MWAAAPNPNSVIILDGTKSKPVDKTLTYSWKQVGGDNLRLKADLVVLSACRTALGKEIRGEGLIGLTRGFMYAGSARVLASLWSVEDRATWKLMEKVYRHLLIDKLPAAESLRRAQLEMAGRGAAPYSWAGFSLQGEWR